MIKGFKDIGVGILKTAADKNMGINAYLDDLAVKGEIDGDFLIPDPAEREQKAGKPISAIGYMAAAAGLNIVGANSSTVEDVRKAGAEPIFWNALAEHTWNQVMGVASERTIHTGDLGDRMRKQTNIPISRDWETNYDSRFLTLSDIVSLNTTTDNIVYQGIDIKKGKATDGYSRVTEGEDIPFYKLATGKRTTTLHKRAAAVAITYEAQKLSRVAEHLEIFKMVAEDERERRLLEGVALQVNGNSPTNASIVSFNGDAAAWGINDFGKWSLLTGASGGNDINLAYADVDTVLDIAALATPAANHALTSRQVGMERRWGRVLPDYTPLKVLRNGSVLDGVNAVIGFDKARALWSVTLAGLQINEKDKNIHNQTIMFTHSEYHGFDKPTYAKTYQLQRHA